MATPFPFQSGATLLASQLNSITELPTRTLSANGTAVAADAYSRVILDGSSITYTINTSTFAAGQVVELYNANSTAATIAAGAGVTLNGAAGLTLAQYQTAELYAVSATSFVLWKSDSPAATSGLTYITGANFTGSSSVTVDNCFTSTYADYEVFLRYTSSADSNLQMRLRAGGSSNSTTNYNTNEFRASASVSSSNATGQTSFFVAYAGQTNLSGGRLTLLNPQVAAQTISLPYFRSNSGGSTAFYASLAASSFTAATQFDGIEFYPTTGTLTGSYKIYGYSNS